MNSPLVKLAIGPKKINAVLDGIQIAMLFILGLGVGVGMLVLLSQLPGWLGASP